MNSTQMLLFLGDAVAELVGQLAELLQGAQRKSEIFFNLKSSKICDFFD